MTVLQKQGLQKQGIWTLSLVLSGVLMFSPKAEAAMVDTSQLLLQVEREQLVQIIERRAVRQQLVALGVDPEASAVRVRQMSGEELAQLNGRLGALPAGSGLSLTDTELLLVILLIVLLL